MFLLRARLVDTNQPLNLEKTTTSATSTTSNSIFLERRYNLHLYRNTSQKSSPPNSNPNSRSTSLFVVAIPNHFSSSEFIQLCGSYINNAKELVCIRNDGMEDRYSVLIKFGDQAAADRFYNCFNEKRFLQDKAEICHILYVLYEEYTASAEVTSTPPEGFTELPTCLICLERLDLDKSGIHGTLCDLCSSKRTYQSCKVCHLWKQQEKPPCSECGSLANLWVCLVCAFVGCRRYERHSKNHWNDTQHRYYVDLGTGQIWDYVSDNYVHRICGDSGIGGAHFGSKLEVIADDYYQLLATQLEAHKQSCESIICEAKSKQRSSISELHDIRSKSKECEEEKKVAEDLYHKRIKDIEMYRGQFETIEARKSESLALKNKEIHTLEEQIEELRRHFEERAKISNRPDADEIRGGTTILKQTSQANNRRGRSGHGRR